MHVVYRLFDASDRLLYVGRTGSDLHERLSVHRAKSWWPQVTYCRLEFPEDRETARTAEWAAIKSEHPLHNKMGVVPVGNQRGGKLPPRHPMSAF